MSQLLSSLTPVAPPGLTGTKQSEPKMPMTHPDPSAIDPGVPELPFQQGLPAQQAQPPVDAVSAPDPGKSLITSILNNMVPAKPVTQEAPAPVATPPVSPSLVASPSDALIDHMNADKSVPQTPAVSPAPQEGQPPASPLGENKHAILDAVLGLLQGGLYAGSSYEHGLSGNQGPSMFQQLQEREQASKMQKGQFAGQGGLQATDIANQQKLQSAELANRIDLAGLDYQYKAQLAGIQNQLAKDLVGVTNAADIAAIQAKAQADAVAATEIYQKNLAQKVASFQKIFGGQPSGNVLQQGTRTPQETANLFGVSGL